MKALLFLMATMPMSLLFCGGCQNTHSDGIRGYQHGQPDERSLYGRRQAANDIYQQEQLRNRGQAAPKGMGGPPRLPGQVEPNRSRPLRPENVARGGKPTHEQLIMAIQDKDADAVREAIVSNVRVDEMALVWASTHGTNEILNMVLASGAIDYINTERYGETPLIAALRYNDVSEVVASLISAGATLDAQETLLIASSHQKNPAVFDVLIYEGGLQLSPECLRRAATVNQSLSVIRYLANSEIDVDAGTPDGVTPLMLASRFNPNPRICRELIRAGADVHAVDKDGKNALMYAADTSLAKGNSSAIRYLLAAGADPDAVSNDGMTALSYAEANSKSGSKSIELLKSAMK